MRVFFIGTVAFSRTVFQKLTELDTIELVGLATKSQSKFNADHSDLSDIAKQNDIPYKYIKDINSEENVSWISSLSPDVIFCFGWSSLIKEELLNLTEMGVIGFHPTKLPENRGRHPIIWALCLGLSETASTFFRMKEGADDGPIVSQRDIKIGNDDDAFFLYKRVEETAVSQLEDVIDILKNKTNLIEQDHSKANLWRKRSKIDGQIDFRMTAESINNLVRALTRPYVGAHLVFQGNEYKVWETSIGENASKNHEPGKILRVVGNQLLVKAGEESTIWLIDHEIDYPCGVNEYII